MSLISAQYFKTKANMKSVTITKGNLMSTINKNKDNNLLVSKIMITMSHEIV